MFYLGAVDSGLVLLELSMRGKPKSVQRIEREQITGLEFKKGLLTDRIRIHVAGQKRPRALYSQRLFREQIQAIASTVAAWTGPPQ